jgi:hypothetical protein
MNLSIVRGGEPSKRAQRMAQLRRALPPSMSVHAWSPGSDETTRYRFFKGAPSGQTYFGPAEAVHTASGFKNALAFAKGQR